MHEKIKKECQVIKHNHHNDKVTMTSPIILTTPTKSRPVRVGVLTTPFKMASDKKSEVGELR